MGEAERWVKSVKDECLSKLILFGLFSLRRALREYITHYHEERKHQSKGNTQAKWDLDHASIEQVERRFWNFWHFS